VKVVAIVQARVDSTRLPGKMLMPLAGKPFIQNVMERALRAKRLYGVILTYPLKDHDAFKPVIDAMPKYTEGTPYGIYAYQGDENDLIDRYLCAATSWHADLIVRIPGDNPCIEPAYIDKAVETYLKYPLTFFSNTTARCEGADVDGIGAEVFSFSRLKWLDEATKGHPDLREHPHKLFNFALGDADVRLDVNTKADYDFMADIYSHFGNNMFHVAHVLEYLRVPR
jgi:spore coat polysaccharide biosynthesis protein SpsF (cytidylyltransferase family)